MKIKSMYPPALVHLEKGWYIVAGEIQEVDGVPFTGAYVPVPANTTLADIEFVRESPSVPATPTPGVERYPGDPTFRLDETLERESSDGREIYKVQRWRSTINRSWFWTCTCKGFRFRGTCKHVTEADADCF